VFTWIITVIVVIIIDQATKLIAVQYLKPIGYFPLWKDVLHLTYVENTGASFGMMKNNRMVLMIITIAAIVSMIIFAVYNILKLKNRHLLFVISVGMIIGGGIGNLINRVYSGYVVDFIDFTLINFAVFNGADSFVCIGVFLFLIYVIKFEFKKEAVNHE
jgi:signal peptidase II